MDDSSPSVQRSAPPASQNTDEYNRYLQSLKPDIPPPKKRKPTIFIIGAAAAIMLLLLAGVLLLKQASNKTATCTNDKCINQRFSKCLPAQYTLTQSGNSIKYTINGAQGIGCGVNVDYIKAQYSSDVIGQTMTCEFDNRLNFANAAQNAFAYPADYSCKGKLADIFQSLNDAANTE